MVKGVAVGPTGPNGDRAGLAAWEPALVTGRGRRVAPFDGD